MTFINTHESAPTGNIADSWQDHVEPITAEEEVEFVFTHPGAKQLFEIVPLTSKIPVFSSAVRAFGPKCFSALSIVYLLGKGIGKNLISFSVYPVFMKRYGVTPEVYQRMSTISSMGFSIKAFSASMSDTFALFQYTKRWYMAASCVVGGACTIAYGLLPSKPSSASGAAGLIFIAMFCIANVDVLSEGHYSRLVKLLPLPGVNLISSIWVAIMVGTIIASGIQGPLSDAKLPQVGIYISAGLQAFCALFFILNWYGEKTNRVARVEDYAFVMAQEKEKQRQRALEADDGSFSSIGDSAVVMCEEQKAVADAFLIPDDAALPNDGDLSLVQFDELCELPNRDAAADNSEAEFPSSDEQGMKLHTPSCCCGIIEVNTEMVSRNVAVVAYGFLMTIGVVALAILTIVANTYQLLYGSVIISVVLCITGFFCIPLTIMKANLFGWFQLTVYLLIPGALDNFYMADAACLPNGPQFSQTFYNTISAVIGNCAGLLGVYLFSQFCTTRSYRLTLIVTTLVQIVASIFDVIMVKRWNIVIGIPDHAMYILGDAVAYQVCYMLSYMPMNMLISRLCPKGCESTMFAILASFSNLGATMSGTIGAILMETIWPIDLKSTPCNFDNVVWLIIAGHLVTPLLCIPAAYLLIPGTRICDEIDPALVEAVPILQVWINKWRGVTTPKTCSVRYDANGVVAHVAKDGFDANEPLSETPMSTTTS